MNDYAHQPKKLSSKHFLSIERPRLHFKFHFLTLPCPLPLKQRALREDTQYPGVWICQVGSLSSIFHWVSRFIKLSLFPLLQGEGRTRSLYIFSYVFFKCQGPNRLIFQCSFPCVREVVKCRRNPTGSQQVSVTSWDSPFHSFGNLAAWGVRLMLLDASISASLFPTENMPTQPTPFLKDPSALCLNSVPLVSLISDKNNSYALVSDSGFLLLTCFVASMIHTMVPWIYKNTEGVQGLIFEEWAKKWF